MDKEFFRIIFVVLVYRNTQDLLDFFKYNIIEDSKVIVVNSYFDEKTDALFRKIAFDNDAEFISVPNKGYGAGNNRGIEYALEKYKFDYLIISNADITIQTFSFKELKKYGDCIIAPRLRARCGKNQNPSSPFKPFKIIEKLLYKVYEGDHDKIVILFYVWSRLNKIIYYLISRFRKKIYSPHGAFFIIPYDILKKIVPIYNERTFLFYEEHHLGKLLYSKKIKVIYVPSIVINHKEDGSVSFLEVNNFKLMKDGYMTYYDYWYR